ncbi:MAG: hypothetical protein WDZ28_03510 [Simkaniaceae bacterium]
MKSILYPITSDYVVNKNLFLEVEDLFRSYNSPEIDPDLSFSVNNFKIKNKDILFFVRNDADNNSDDLTYPLKFQKKFLLSSFQNPSKATFKVTELFEKSQIEQAKKAYLNEGYKFTYAESIEEAEESLCSTCDFVVYTVLFMILSLVCYFTFMIFCIVFPSIYLFLAGFFFLALFCIFTVILSVQLCLSV